MGPPARWAPELDATVTEPRPRPPASAGRFAERESATAQATSPSVHRDEDGGRHGLNVRHQLAVLTKLVDEVWRRPRMSEPSSANVYAALRAGQRPVATARWLTLRRLDREEAEAHL